MATSGPGTSTDPPPAIPDDQAGSIPLGDAVDEDEGDSCRICRGEASMEQPLFYPCKCSGSIRFVHQDCLMEWLAHSKKKYCELCKTPFRFTKLHDKSMPAILPLPLFVRQVLLHFFQALTRWSRYTLVATVWFICLPWCIRQVWRGLFWLADGSWLADSSTFRPNVPLYNMSFTVTDKLNLTITNQSFINVPLADIPSIVDRMINGNSSAPSNSSASSIVNQPASGGTWIGALFRLLTGESLITKVLKILFTIPPPLRIGPSLSTNGTSIITTGRKLRRPPSLLSDVTSIKSLALSPFLNHITLDVLEGVLICLALVAGFILIFLIREWVINQQPLLNIPDPDRPENPPAPAGPPGNDAGRVLRRHRRRIIPRAAQPAAEEGQDPNEPATEPVHPSPRRALTEDNIGVATATGLERPDFPVRSQSLANIWPETNLDADEAPPTFPPPLLRGAIGDAVNVHRAIEEAPLAEDDREVHPSILFEEPIGVPDAERLEDVNDIPAGPLPRPSTPTVQFDPAIEVIGNSVDVPTPVAEPEIQHSSGSDSPQIPTPDSGREDQSNDPINPASETVLEPPIGPEGIIIAGPFALDDVSSTTDTEGRETEAVDAEPVHPNVTATDRLADWLWHVDTPIPDGAPHAAHDDEHVIADIDAEAPFVPVRDRDLPFEANFPRVQPPPANLEQALNAPDMPQNVDWNDPNAVDEIEDLEGVMELIGMEGPIIGMMQNVVFSLFLITVTLTGSVWIPYIWGKITLLLLAHPVVVLVKAPIFLLSNTADLVAEVVFFLLGIIAMLFNSFVIMFKTVTAPIFPPLNRLLDTTWLEDLARNVTHQSGTRLEKTLTATFLTLSPDLPAFSVQSHRALVSFKTTIRTSLSYVVKEVATLYGSAQKPHFSLVTMKEHVLSSGGRLSSIPGTIRNGTVDAISTVKSAFNVQLKPLTVDLASSDFELVEWSTQDKIIAIVMGYLFFFVLGYCFLRITHVVMGLKNDEKVEGPFADGFRQASGVLKVIIIIGIEMIIFPLYCGLLLDLALLPLFEGATIHTRLAFMVRAPFTGLFLHWFIGTCYMFHFALFVSICRKILRKGVLYFIRDPDDPTFHPVRDVLERPVPTQLGKIAFSALVYGGLVIMCLGGVVWGVGRIEGVLPIRWSTPEPRLEFPVDVVFYNLLLPFIVRQVEPSKKVSAIYEWWFRGCAHGLRLTQFLFGEEREDEKHHRTWPLLRPSGETDGSYVRAPASDSCRVPRNKNVFLEVDANNERLDGQPDNDKGLHGKADNKWTKVYLPPRFKARIGTFVVLLWVFATATGVGFTIGPLLVGRQVLKLMSGSPRPVNDLYAFTIGFHILAVVAYAATYSRQTLRSIVPHLRSSALIANMRQVWPTLKYIVGLAYLLAAFIIVFPFTLSLVAEMYVHMPILTFLLASEKRSSHTDSPKSISFPPTIFLLQTWTLGLLYLRLAFRLALNYPCPHTRLATAIQTVFRNGYLHPDVRLVSRAIVLPLTALCLILLVLPLVYARILIAVMRVSDPEAAMLVYRMAYPAMMGLAATAYVLMLLKRRLEVWRLRIRDEVYLVGERLHNYVDKKDRRRKDKGKGKEKAA